VARATPTRFFCPPESPEGSRSSKPARDTAREPVGHPRGDLGLVGDAHPPQGEGDVVGHREVIEEGVVLKEHPDARAHPVEAQLVDAGHGLAAEMNRARVGGNESHEGLEQYALARRARPTSP
jgi:hypothetical protein